MEPHWSYTNDHLYEVLLSFAISYTLFAMFVTAFASYPWSSKHEKYQPLQQPISMNYKYLEMQGGAGGRVPGLGIPFLAPFCLGSCKLGRMGFGVGDDGASISNSTQPRPPAPPCRLVNKGRKELCGDQAFPLTRGEHKDNRALDCFNEDGIQLGVVVVALLSIASCIFQAAYYKVHHIWSPINGPQIKDGAVH